MHYVKEREIIEKREKKVVSEDEVGARVSAFGWLSPLLTSTMIDDSPVAGFHGKTLG